MQPEEFRVRVHSRDPTRTDVAPCSEAFATAYAPALQAARWEPAVTQPSALLFSPLALAEDPAAAQAARDAASTASRR